MIAPGRTEWTLRGAVTLGFYAVQIFLVAHWRGRAAAGYYAPTLPVSGAYSVEICGVGPAPGAPAVYFTHHSRVDEEDQTPAACAVWKRDLGTEIDGERHRVLGDRRELIAKVPY